MITIEHPFKGKSRLSKEEQDLAEKIKKSARYKIHNLTLWYIDQLAELLESQEQGVS